MHDHLQPTRVLSYLFIFGIAVLFALQWGPGSRGCETKLGKETSEVAASVNGRDIPIRDFARAYSNRLNQMRMMGSPIPESMARQFGLPAQVLDQLVVLELLA